MNNKGKTKGDDEMQVRCWTADEGHVWLHVFDTLPPPVRQRLRSSPFNLCPACLVCFFEPQVRKKQPGLSRERALLAAIELMEAEVRRENK